MKTVSAIPVQIQCQTCHETLLELHLDVEHDGAIARSWLLVDAIHVVCPNCGGTIAAATDDFSRIIDEINKLE